MSTEQTRMRPRNLGSPFSLPSADSMGSIGNCNIEAEFKDTGSSNDFFQEVYFIQPWRTSIRALVKLCIVSPRLHCQEHQGDLQKFFFFWAALLFCPLHWQVGEGGGGGEAHSRKPSLHMQCFPPVLHYCHFSCNPSQLLHPWKQ